MSKDKKAMRYAARLTAIYDWHKGIERTPERLSKADCIEAVHGLSSVHEYFVRQLWDQASNEFPHIGNEDIEAVYKWILPEVIRVYDMQIREIKAVGRLREVFEAEGTTLSELQEQTGELYWRFAAWINFHNRLPWLMVLAVESLDSTKRPWKTFEVYKERDRLRGHFNADYTRTKETKESDGLST